MSENDTAGPGRRDLFRVGAGAVAAAAATSTAAAQADAEFDYDGWFEDVPNYEGTVDRTGEDEVSVVVGPGGDLVFEPPAIHVDPGTPSAGSGRRGSTTSPNGSPASATRATPPTSPARPTRSPSRARASRRTSANPTRARA